MGVVLERTGSEAEGWRYWVDVFYHRTWEFDEAEFEPREPEPAFKWRWYRALHRWARRWAWRIVAGG